MANLYPGVKVQRGFEATLEASVGVPPRAETRDLGIHGLMFRSVDELNVAQFQRDGFAFSRLRPYTSWEEIVPEATRLWELYREYFQPEEARRVAVRYINHIAFAKEDFEFARYLTSPPIVHQPLPQLVSAFLSTVVVQDADRKLSARITQSLEQPAADATKVAFLLDIDVFKTSGLRIDPHAIRADLDLLRAIKNDAFFACLTDEAVELLV